MREDRTAWHPVCPLMMFSSWLKIYMELKGSTQLLIRPLHKRTEWRQLAPCSPEKPQSGPQMLITMAVAITNTGREKMADSQGNLRSSFESQWCLEHPVMKAHGLGVQNAGGQRLIEFCQENALVITNTLFQQHKKRLYTWTSPDGQHWNQIDYSLCSQKWRSSIQSAKTIPGADYSSDNELWLTNSNLNWRK